MLTAIDTPTSGTITTGDLEITHAKARRLTKWRARNVGIVFQFFQLPPTLTVVENVMMPMHCFGRVLVAYCRGDVAVRDSTSPDLWA